ncbi:MAG: efflux RND transporter periplasmic adaptor subunit [Rhodospirillales bacterium]|jgi:membrane fusion protein, multidrug efflux system|nr:efflux RND transporter periplasmic adaptor subunit [Rhodospirillales bacterium]
MKRSYLFAVLVAVSVLGWIMSGQIGQTSVTEGAEPIVGTAAADEVLPKVRVRTMVAQQRDNEIVLFGRTEAERVVDVMAETKGRVISRLVKKGDRVKRGDVLVRVAMDDRKARLAEAEAVLEQRKIAFEAAQKLSKKQFRSVVTLAQNKAELQSAKARLEAIKLDIQRCTIRAPFAGVVDELPAEIGYVVNVGSAVARVVDLDPILIVGEVAERNVSAVALGSLGIVRLITGAEVGGTVSYVSKVGDEATRTFRVEVEVDNPKGEIAEGLTTELRLPLGSVFAHRVSPALLTLSDEGVVGIKVVGSGDIVKFYPAILVADTADGVWLGGLPERMNLITVGQEFVRIGQRVVSVPEGATGGDGGAS